MPARADSANVPGAPVGQLREVPVSIRRAHVSEDAGAVLGAVCATAMTSRASSINCCIVREQTTVEAVPPNGGSNLHHP